MTATRRPRPSPERLQELLPGYGLARRLVVLPRTRQLVQRSVRSFRVPGPQLVWWWAPVWERSPPGGRLVEVAWEPVADAVGSAVHGVESVFGFG